MITFIIIMSLAFIWLGYEADWMRVRLLIGVDKTMAGRWCDAFHFKMSWFDYTRIPLNLEPIARYGHYNIELSPGVGVMCGQKWLDKHYHDLDNYEPKVELYFGNGYRQTFTLRKPELMLKIMKINTGKKYFKHLALAP